MIDVLSQWLDYQRLEQENEKSVIEKEISFYKILFMWFS